MKRFFIAGGLFLFLVFLFLYINSSYPVVGHDYRYSIPHLLDTYIHYLKNGLTIQWFSPAFGGGLPAYGNPQHLQYSLTQFLVFLVNPWLAVILSIIVYTILGYYACYRFARDIFQVGWKAAVLGALFFVGTGFYIQHNAAGPMTVQAYPLIALFIYILVLENWAGWQRGIVLGLILTLFIHGSSFYLVIILGLCILIILPLIYLLRPGNIGLQAVVIALGVGGLTGLLLSAGKLYAVFGFMQNFPRVITDHYYANFWQALVGFGMQLVGVPLFTIPFRVLIEDATAVGQMMTALIGGSEFGMWEMDISVSPVLVYIFLFQLRKLPRKVRDATQKKTLPNLQQDRVVALLVLILGVWFAFEYISARGILYGFVSDLPVVRSLHVNIRYAAAFVFPLAVLGAYFFDREFSRIKPNKSFKVFSIFFMGTLLWLGVYFLLPNELQSRNYNLEQTLSDYRRVKDGEDVYVAEVKDVIDYQVFSNHVTSLYPYDPIFGYNLEDFSTQLIPGSIYIEEDGYYNMTNPRSLVYDSEELFERFTIEEREMMEQFAHYRQPDWNIPPLQNWLNTLSGVTFLVILGYGLVLLGRRLSGFRQNNSS